MRFTLDTDASTLTHPVQLCLVTIPMIVPSTYRKCTYFPSSKTVTSGYDSLRNINPRDIYLSADEFEEVESDKLVNLLIGHIETGTGHRRGLYD